MTTGTAGRLRALTRDRVLAAAAAGYLAIGLALGSLGPVLARLRDELHVGGSVAALHGTAYGVALLGVAAGGSSLERRWGRTRLLRGSTVLLASGLLGLALAPTIAVSLGAAWALGVGAALLVVVLPSALHDHPGSGPHTFADVNAVASLASTAAPAALAAALALALGWRVPFAVLALAAGGVAVVAARRTHLPTSAPAAGTSWRLLAEPRFAAGWAVLALSITVEFATLTWVASFAREVRGDPDGVAVLLGALFGLGMLVGRLAGSTLLGRWPASMLRPASLAGVTAASVVLFVGPGVAARVVGAAAAGLAAAMLYPLGMERLFDLAPGRATSVSSAGALAGGVAITVGPLLLGALADVGGLARAVLVVPALAGVALAVELALGRRPTVPDDRPASEADEAACRVSA